MLFIEIVMSLLGVPTDPVYQITILILAAIIFLEILNAVFRLINVIIFPLRDV